MTTLCSKHVRTEAHEKVSLILGIYYFRQQYCPQKSTKIHYDCFNKLRQTGWDNCGDVAWPNQGHGCSNDRELQNHKNIQQRQTELSWRTNFAHLKITYGFWKDIEILLTLVCVCFVLLAHSSSQKFASRWELSLSCCCWQQGFTQHQSNHCEKRQVMAPSLPISFACLFILAWLPCPLPDIASQAPIMA